MGSKEDVAARIDKNTEAYIAQMAQEVANNKDKVRFIILCCVLCIRYLMLVYNRSFKM